MSGNGQSPGQMQPPSWVPPNSPYVGRMQQFNQQPAYGGPAQMPAGTQSSMQPPQTPTLQAPMTQQQLAAHMAQRNNITNGYVAPGQTPTQGTLAAHMAANNAYTNSYGTPGQVPLPPWLQK